jgi:YD repeat-containing protein
MCLAQGAAAQLVASSPGSCGLGSCSLGLASTTLPWTIQTNWMGLNSAQNVSFPSNGDQIDVATWVPLPLGPGGTTTVGSGFVTQQITAGVGNSPSAPQSCVSGGTFGSPSIGGTISPSSLQPGPALTAQLSVLVVHRHNSPFGSGWGLDEVPRLYTPPQSTDHATLVRGDGSEEDFRPQLHITTQLPNAGNRGLAFAVDPMTGDQVMADNVGNLVKINGDGTSTTLQAGLAFDGPPQSLAITYIGGQRNFLVALSTRLLWVQSGGTSQTIYTRTNTPQSLPSQVAANGAVAIYTEGQVTKPYLYRIALTSPVGTPQVISYPTTTGGDMGLEPTTTSVSGYQFYGPAGLAYTATGQLYVADAPRNAVYLLGVDTNGQISGSSSIKHVIGDGAGRWVPQLGDHFAGVQFPINQPYYLSTSPDGTLLLGAGYGVAAYDPVQTEAQWIAFDHNTPASDLTFSFFSFVAGTSTYTNLAAVGPRTFLLAPTSSGTYPSLFDASVLGSDLDPTRTLTFPGGTGVLVDTTQALIENYDAQGRLVQRELRTGEPILSVTYADATSDRVAAITDPEGNSTTFNYDAGTQKLSSITDPQGRVTSFGRNSFGDLTSLTQPDGETMTFAYDGHHMTSKTTRGTDTTTYVYNADGSLHSATKPAGETTTLSASLSVGGGYVNGVFTESGTYTDAHGVSHAFVTDTQGQIQSDVYTADGVTYTRALVYASQLDALSTEFQHRGNNDLLRVASTTLNGVPLSWFEHYDDLGRVDAEDGRSSNATSTTPTGGSRTSSSNRATWINGSRGTPRGIRCGSTTNRWARRAGARSTSPGVGPTDSPPRS